MESRQSVENIGKHGGLLADSAAVRGGEVALVFLSFNKVMLMDGTTVEPKKSGASIWHWQTITLWKCLWSCN